MTYMFVEIRGNVLPMLTQINIDIVNEIFLDNIDEETEMIIRYNENKFEKYILKTKSWEKLPQA